MMYCSKNEQSALPGLKYATHYTLISIVLFFLRIINEFLDDVIKNQGLSLSNNAICNTEKLSFF